MLSVTMPHAGLGFPGRLCLTSLHHLEHLDTNVPLLKPLVPYFLTNLVHLQLAGKAGPERMPTTYDIMALSWLTQLSLTSCIEQF